MQDLRTFTGYDTGEVGGLVGSVGNVGVKVAD